jgi:hypothetical protein
MKLIFITVFLFCCIIAQDNKETIFGKTYTYKITREVGDDEIEFYLKSHYLKDKPIFGYAIKGLRNDSIIMTSKIKMLTDTISITEVYLKNKVYMDSILYLKIFKKGEYLGQEFYEYKNGKLTASGKLY